MADGDTDDDLDDGSLVATVAEPLASLAQSSPSMTAARTATVERTSEVSAATLSTLQHEEAVRASSFGRTIALLAGSATVFSLFLGGPAWLRAGFAAACATLVGVAVWVWQSAARRDRYDLRQFRVFGWTAVAASFAVTYYVGVFSAAPLAVTLGISFFGLGDDRKSAIAMCAVAATGYIVLGILIVVGAIPDLSIFPASDASLTARIFALTLVPMVYLVALWQARISRQATYRAIERINGALDLAQQREAQLHEANRALDEALEAGAGGKGRHSGAMAGRYLLAEVIGRGAMGEVYAGAHVDSGELAAVKLLTIEGARPEALARFLREADITATLRSANIVSVRDVGHAADGTPYIAMERLVGHDLSWHLRRRRQLPLAEVLTLVEQIAAGLDHAHGAGIIHRDVKPQNMFRDESATPPVWKILDFGVSKLRGSSDTLTQRAVVGTPGYMSPEQAQGLEATPRSDVFALAAVAYRALTARPPFSGPDMPQVLFDVVYRNPVRPSQYASRLPRDVERVLALAMAKQPERRHERVADLASQLRAAATGTLDHQVRSRADALLKKHGWGQIFEAAGARPAAGATRD